jgi:hypothetical protein
MLTGCCPNENLFERSLKRFLFINLGAVKEKRFQLFELEGRVLESPGTSLRFIKKCFRASENDLGNSPLRSVRAVTTGVFSQNCPYCEV